MNEEQKHALEERRRRLRSLGRDLDIIDKVRLQRLRKRRKEEEEVDRENGDIYDYKQRGEMLDGGIITASENAFMQGREKSDKKKKTRS